MGCSSCGSKKKKLASKAAGPLRYDTSLQPLAGKRCAVCHLRTKPEKRWSDGVRVRVVVCVRGHVGPC